MTQTTMTAPPSHWPTAALRTVTVLADRYWGFPQFETFILAEDVGDDPKGTIWYPLEGGAYLKPHWHWSTNGVCGLGLATESREVSALIDAHCADTEPER